MELNPAIIQQTGHIESIIRRDPGKRGLLRSHDIRIDDLGAGELANAAASLNQASQVAILTGFFIPVADRQGNAETDGPLGAALLGRVLANCGIPVQILTDENCAPVVQAAFKTAREIAVDGDAMGTGIKNQISNCEVVVLGEAVDSSESYWASEFGRGVSHIVSIERVGPSFTADEWDALQDGDVAEFASTVSSELQDCCFNMRGECIDVWTCEAHRIFENAPSRVTRIGIGDGGNELGLGKFGWKTIANRLGLHTAQSMIESPGRPLDSDRSLIAARIPCRVSADHTILAGVSNWGADALAAVFCLLRYECEQLNPFDQNAIEQILTAMVVDGNALDGVTKLNEPTVDGLPFITYIQPWNAIRSIVLD